MAPGTDVNDLLPDTALTGPNGITSAPAVLKEPMLKVVLPCLRRSSPKAKFLVHYSFSSLVAQMRMWAARSDGPGCKSGLPSFWSFYPSLRRACLLHFCNDLFLQFAFLNDISFLSENGLEWREGRCRSADKSAWDKWRHTAGYRSAEAVLRTDQDHFSAFAIIRFRSRNPVTFVVAKMVHGQAHKRRPPSRHVVDACRTGFWDAEDEELPYAVGSSEDGALTAALVTRSEKAECAIGIGAETAVARSAA